MAPEISEKKAEKSYLTSAVDSINPWGGKRASSPAQDAKSTQTPQPPATGTAPVDPGDHSITHLYGQSFRTYPRDCPPLHVQWYHAIDVPKRKPQWVKSPPPKEGPKQPSQPKKFSAFSAADSKALETRYQELLEASEDAEEAGAAKDDATTGRKSKRRSGYGYDNNNTEDASNVPVNEDYLFDVNIPQRELAPVYWLGPVYEVRRGTWFFNEGSSLKPCEENLAAQLEEGYLKLKPWLNPVRSRSPSGASRPTPKVSNEDLKATAEANTSAKKEPQKKGHVASSSLDVPSAQPQSHRLFGTYMNSLATYQDASTAWLSSDTMLSWVTSSVYERFAGGAYMSGVKLTRGFAEPAKAKDKEAKSKEKGKEDDETLSANGDIPGLDMRQQKILNRRSAPPTTGSSKEEQSEITKPSSTEVEGPHSRLQRQLSSLMEVDGRGAETEEQIQQQQEQEMQDYHAQAGVTQEREVDHLVLVTHGIGQQLSLRMESVNFVHDVNVLRKTLKSVYASSADLKALNSELGSGNGNCRVQVLPVCWRHLLDFPKQRQKRGEHDLGDTDSDEHDYPSLEDITVEGVAFARSLISDLALDVLLYQSSYRSQISRIVLKECNRILKLYKDRNPGFKGKVHFMGHSLGSAILFDILCRQKHDKTDDSKNPLRFWPSQGRQETAGSKDKDQKMALDFDVEDFYCLGSPIGLFEMLEGRTIAARRAASNAPFDIPLGAELQDDPFLAAPMGGPNEVPDAASGRPLSVASPKVRQLFNIFHPSDPISYRLEPLVSPAMRSLKPQGLPYTKKGLLTAANQGLTGIGAKVGQSVSGLWSSLSAGIASNMLNRSLGLTNEEVARMTDQVQSGQQKQPPGAGTNISAGGVIADDAKTGEKTDARKKQLADSAASGNLSSASGNDPTLIDDELETLFSQFQRRRAEAMEDELVTDETQEATRKLRKMRAEEAKVRALNRNGRVDYSIQESVLDFNPINTIASHMGYWADVDVNHFVLSQLLSSRSRSSVGDVAKHQGKRGPIA